MFDPKKIALRAVVTAVEAFLAVILTSNFTELTADAAETAAAAGVAAGLSVVYNALRQYLDSTSGEG